MKRILKYGLASIGLLVIGFISFVLYSTRDEINATPENIQSRLEEYFNQTSMAGFHAAVFTSEKTLYEGTVGMSDVENVIPLTNRHQQYIASISKTFIGVALMKGVEQGLFKLSDPINNYLPFEVSNPFHPDEFITIEHLATHTSSLDYNEKVVDNLYTPDSLIAPSLEGFMTSYFDTEEFGEVLYTNHKPGSNWNYSNIASALAAYIIEVTSGMTFDRYTAEYIFEPLEMRHSTWYASSIDSINRTAYYEPNEDGSIRKVKTSGVTLYPVSDLLTNSTDLSKFGQAMLNRDERLLSSSSFDTMLGARLDPQTVTNLEPDNHGIFWMLDRNNLGIVYPMIGMNGGDNCIQSMMWFDPYRDLGYVFIGNSARSERSFGNHIWITRALVSLGDHHIMNDSNRSWTDRMGLRWHNVKSRIGGLF